MLFFNDGNIYSRYCKPFQLIIACYFYHNMTTMTLLDSVDKIVLIKSITIFQQNFEVKFMMKHFI